MKKALPFGLTASFFFAFTFVLNRSMNLGGGFWLWSAALRYFFTLPILFLLLLRGKKFLPVLKAVKAAPGQWLLWSTVGFGLFYAPLTAASTFAESWFTAATWQLTIVCGVLLTPLFGKKLPLKNLVLSGIILVGIALIQLPKAENIGFGLLPALGLILIAAFCYPLGNRKMMEVCAGQELSTLQRTFGMVLCSVPFWLICSVISGISGHVPSGGQILQSFLVALFSGVIATLLFFRATDIVKENPRQLAVVEAAQCGEVVFTLLLGVLVLGDAAPGAVSLLGIALVVLGMILNSLATGD